jgi:hypothetical protein
MTHMAAAINHIANLAHIVKTDFTKDSSSKNAAIDSICDILNGYKDAEITPPTQ